MRQLKLFWRSVFDVRPGEGLRTLFMTLHMMCVMFAYYILKPVSNALFLHKFEIDKLPYLYVLIAIPGGLLAYAYTRVAVRSSLMNAVNWATAIAVASLVGFWWLLRFKFDLVLYLFNIWVSLFSIIMMSQAWLVAANVFDSREAKRLYGLIGFGAVAGAAFGGEFTARLARAVKLHDLLLATAGMVLLAYGFIRAVAAQKNVNVASARAAGAEGDFAFKDILSGIRRHRHLQVIMAIITITYLVDVMVQFQFSALAKASYHDEESLTAFLGSFYGLYMNVTTFVMQLFLTAMIVRHLGVGGTLQIMPVMIAIASSVMIFVPKMATASALRLFEAATRYSFNRTGMELLYVPLPLNLKNRTKAFVDIFMDRFGRGLGGALLMAYLAFIEKDPKHPNLTRVSAMILAISIFWILLSARVGREYLATIRRRLESRRLDFDDARIAVAGAETVALLEKTLSEGSPRQAAYALGLLAEVPGYDLGPHVETMARHAAMECRAQAYEVAAGALYKGLTALAAGTLATEGAMREQHAALAYLVSVSTPGGDPEAAALATNDATNNATIDAAWVRRAAGDSSAWRRALAAYAIGLLGKGCFGTDTDGTLRQLLDDRDAVVASAACRSAGQIGNRIHFEQIAQRLHDHAVRGAAVAALAMYGARVCGSLGDILTDENAPVPVRRQIPRVLRLIHDQRSVDVLIGSAGCADLTIRAAVLKALNRLRESAPGLQFPAPAIAERIQAQATYCLRLHALLLPLRAGVQPRTVVQPRTGVQPGAGIQPGSGIQPGPGVQPRSAAALLVRTLETRLRQSMDGLFRLLGLHYPPIEIYNAWLALESGQADRVSAAHDYLDSILEREVKRVVMPLLESRDRIALHARDSFRLDASSPEAALAEMLRSGDSWMVTCAIATAAEMNLKGLAAAIAGASEHAGPETVAVARHAAAALA